MGFKLELIWPSCFSCWQEAWRCKQLQKVLFNVFFASELLHVSLLCFHVSMYNHFPMKVENWFKSHNEAKSIMLSGGAVITWKLLRDILPPLEPLIPSTWRPTTVYVVHLYGERPLLCTSYSSCLYIILAQLFNKISELPGFRPFVQYGKSSGAEWGQVRTPCFEPNKCCPPPIVLKYAKSQI